MRWPPPCTTGEPLPPDDPPPPMTRVLHGDAVDLVPVTLRAARAVLAGDLSGIVAAPGYPHEDTADALSGIVAVGDDEGTGCWFIVRRSDGVVLGDLGWRDGPDPTGAVEIGYGLAASARGLGHGTDAVRTLAAWVRTQPGVERIRAEVLADNIASRRLLERLGFKLESSDPPHVYYCSLGASSPG